MSASFYDLLKYAQTGIASPDMTYYDRMRASTLMGGVVQTLTGQPPLSFKADGTPLISWSMKGNGTQTGTPAPDNIITPEMCGVRTSNLFDEGNALLGYEIINDYIRENSNWFVSDFIPVESGKKYIATNAGAPALGYETKQSDSIRLSGSIISGITIPENIHFIRVNGQLSKISSVMLNSGSTALPYEPYGYKIHLTCAGQTVPVYLGHTQTVRKIRKLVLTGEERYSYQSQYSRYIFTIQDAFADGTRKTQCICSHYISVHNGEAIYDIPNNSIYINQQVAGTQFCIKDESITSADDFKAFLAAQYAAGTPVVIWYILAEPETTIVNEPLCKIGDYADELSSTDAGVAIPTVNGSNTLTVDTDLQPSEMTITFKG